MILPRRGKEHTLRVLKHLLLITPPIQASDRDEIRRKMARLKEKIPDFNFKLLKEKIYSYEELELLAKKHWKKAPPELKTASLKDVIADKYYGHWQNTARQIFEPLAAIILEDEEKMTVVQPAETWLGWEEEYRIAKDLGMINIAIKLYEQFGTKGDSWPYSFRSSEDEIRKHPLWSQLQQLKGEYRKRISELQWQRFYKRYVCSNKRSSKAVQEELDVLQSLIKEHFILDLIAFTTGDSWLPRKICHIEVKTTKQKRRLTDYRIKRFLSFGEQYFIADNLDKVGILVICFQVKPEEIILGYYEPRIQTL